MIVVADSGPLHYLILIEEVDLLRALYTEVVIPEEVVAELSRSTSPSAVKRWFSAPPPWLRIVPVSAQEIATVTDSLDVGERAAIALAEIMAADFLLIDERAGRREAQRRHIRITGTVGVLRSAAERGLIDVPDVLARLQATNFYVDELLLEDVFARWLRK